MGKKIREMLEIMAERYARWRNHQENQEKESQPEKSCPYCHVEVVVEVWDDDADYQTPPNPGDYAVCFNCLNPVVVAEDSSFRKPTEVEMNEIFASPIFLEMLAVLQQSRKKENH